MEATTNRPRQSSEILDRLPPFDLEHERALLASLIIHPPMADEVVGVVTEGDFYEEEHRLIYRAFVELFESGSRVDELLMAAKLKKDGVYERIGGAATLAKICLSAASAYNATYYATRVRECSVRRQLIDMSTECLRNAYDDAEDWAETLERHESKIMSIAESTITEKPLDIKDVLHSSLAALDLRANGQSRAVATGFRDVDQMLAGGFWPGQLIVLAARPAMGKSALALNIAENISVGGNVVLFFSLEMSKEELGERFLSSLSGVSGHRMRAGTIGGDERAQIIDAAADASRAKLTVCDTPMQSVRFMAAQARRQKRRGGLSLVVVDYLQLIDCDDRRDNREQQVAKITRRLKCLAKELECPVLCVAQLNRQAETDANSRPRLKHLRESGAIEQDADVVLFVHREEYYQPNKPEVQGAGEIIIAKQRSGPAGSVNVVYQKETMRFRDMAASRFNQFDEYNRRGADSEVFN